MRAAVVPPKHQDSTEGKELMDKEEEDAAIATEGKELMDKEEEDAVTTTGGLELMEKEGEDAAIATEGKELMDRGEEDAVIATEVREAKSPTAWLLQRWPKAVPKFIDTTLSGGGLALSISLLCFLQVRSSARHTL